MWWQKSDKKRIETVRGRLVSGDFGIECQRDFSIAGFEVHREFGFGGAASGFGAQQARSDRADR